MNQPKARREGKRARLLRLQNMLIEIYADLENARAWHRVKFDEELDFLCQKWREIRPRGVHVHPAEREASASYRDYRDALLRVVGQRLGLEDEHGNALLWALNGVDLRVSSAASPGSAKRASGPSVDWVVYPTLMERAYKDLEGFELYMSPVFFQLRTPYRDDERELRFGDQGLGLDEWDKYRKFAHQAVEDGIEDMKTRFEAVVSASGTMLRPSSIEKDRQALVTLHEHLATSAPILEGRTKKKRAVDIARDLGIRYPRRPLP